jgi:hypothetical protein
MTSRGRRAPRDLPDGHGTDQETAENGALPLWGEREEVDAEELRLRSSS